MLLLRRETPPTASVAATVEQRRRRWRTLSANVIMVTLVMGLYALTRAPGFVSVTLAAYIGMALWITARPRAGVYLVAFFTLLGDFNTTPWYPFSKNFSMEESISYVSDALTIPPIEVVLGVTFAAWLLQCFGNHRWTVRRGPLFWPMMNRSRGCFNRLMRRRTRFINGKRY